MIPLIKWALLYIALWALLTSNQGWGFGALFIALALFCTVKSGLRGPSFSLRHSPAFLLFFLHRLIVGGIDVAVRTLKPTPSIKPVWVIYPMQTADTQIQLALSAIVGLLPGTLVARIENNTMKIHLLDSEQDWQRDIATLEQHLMRILNKQEKSE